MVELGYRKFSIKPLRVSFILNTFKEGGLFSLAKKMLSNLHKELPCKVEKLKYKKLEVMQPMIKNKSERPVWIDPHEVLLSLD